ncbi:MAG: hypothetical protein GY818_17685 [Planctomycetaceae bacterium]|nr:hypothetical protein [Planctomycetaceae bacterium]
MSKQPISPSQHVVADHELERLKGLVGFNDFEHQLEADLEKLTQRWSAWHVPRLQGSFRSKLLANFRKAK